MIDTDKIKTIMAARGTPLPDLTVRDEHYDDGFAVFGQSASHRFSVWIEPGLQCPVEEYVAARWSEQIRELAIYREQNPPLADEVFEACLRLRRAVARLPLDWRESGATVSLSPEFVLHVADLLDGGEDE